MSTHYIPPSGEAVDFEDDKLYSPPIASSANFVIVSVNYTQLSIAPNGGKPFKVVSQPISKPVRFQL